MIKRYLSIFLTTMLLGLISCSTQNLQDYKAERPVLDLKSYFNGTIDAYGIFTDWTGEVTKRFTVVIVCQWNGSKGILDETFTYSDGSLQKRIWHLERLTNGKYTGRADDVIGEAHGDVAGNTFHWSYTLRLPVDKTTYEVDFDDWMYLVDDRVMLNKAKMSKFGLPLGEVTLSFVKRP